MKGVDGIRPRRVVRLVKCVGRWPVAIALLCALLLLSASPALADESLFRTDGPSVFSPDSPPAESIRHLFVLVLAISAGIFLLVEGVLLYSIVRFRRRRSSHAAEPPQIYGSRPVELAWTVGPLLTVFVLFLIVFRTVFDAQAPSTPDGQTVEVQTIGHQWWWEYRIRDTEFGDVIVVNELHVPVGDDQVRRPIALELQSADVIHSYWVPRLSGKIDLVPGRTNHLWFEPQQTGTFYGQCAEYCGNQHANMKLVVMADEPDEFRSWLRNQSQDAVNDPSVRAGREKFFSLACVNCHTIRGTTAAGTFGPDLTHLMSRTTIGAGAAENTRENLLRWVDDPKNIKPGCNMPSMHLNKQDVDLVVSYLETLR